MHLSYMSFLSPGDEVLVPSFTFFATASMVSAAGGRPVFCDVDPKSFLIDLDYASKKLSDNTRAISPVHLFGNPCNVELIREFATNNALKVVWDAAQAHGGTYRGKDIGSFDDFVCYSFYPSKNMFVGEGGMTCTNSEEYADKIRKLRMHGQSVKYYHTMLGLNYRMTEIEAAIGREQLKRLDDMLEIRRRNARELTERLSDVSGVLTPKPAEWGNMHGISIVF